MLHRLMLGAAVAGALSLAAAGQGALAHGGEDHGAPVASAPVAAVAQSGFAAEGSAFQAVLVGDGQSHALLYLADVDGNAPIANAHVEAEVDGWQGIAQPTALAGVYSLDWAAPSIPATMTLIITAEGRDDLLLIQNIVRPPESAASEAKPVAHWTHWTGGGAVGAAIVLAMLALNRRRRRKTGTTLSALVVLLAANAAHAHGGEDHGAPAQAAPAPPPGASIIMPKATQFLLGIRTARIEPKEAADTVRVVGKVIPDPSGHARIQPSQPARVLAETDIPLPVPGQTVKRGQVLAVLEPTLSTLEKGDRRAALARIDSDLAIQEREAPRLEAMSSAIPFRTLETNRIRLEQLRKERMQIAGTALGRELVVAPADGVVTDMHLVPGEVVTADRVLVEIIDPTRLRVEAIIHDVAVAGRIAGAVATTRLRPDQTFTLSPVGISPRVDPVDQGVHALFAVSPQQAPLLRVGLPVDVFLATGAARLRTAIPRDAIAESGGRQVVFVRTAPETFQARPIAIHRIIGGMAEIEGVQPGERVVTQGVEQIKAAR